MLNDLNRTRAYQQEKKKTNENLHGQLKCVVIHLPLCERRVDL